MKLFAPAKVNLFLSIQGKDESGYHLLDTVFLRTSLLQDELTIEPAEEFSFNCPEIPGEDNTVVRAVRLLEEKTGRTFHYKIHLKKNIPLGSGLGGGSSDAAVILQFLNEHEELGYAQEELMQLGAQIGMDVPFFLSGYDMAHGTHYGEKVEPLPLLPTDIKLRIILGDTVVSTKEAFANWDHENHALGISSQAFIQALRAQDSQAILKNLHNDFQVFYGSPSLKPGEYAILTGSGSAWIAFSLT